MTVNRTTLLNLPLPVTGTESGTWGDTTNNGLTQYIDIAVAGMTSLTSSDFTAGALSLSNSTGDSSATNIAASSAQYGAIKVSSLATNSTITAPSSNRRYVIINADATYNLIIKASGQTGVTVVPGEKALVAFNGTDYVKVGGAAGGSTTQIQFNNAGVFGGSANLTWDGTNVQIGAAGALRLADTDSSNYVAFKSPSTVASNVTWTLPSADGTNGQALTTNGSGTLAFSTISTAAATPTTLGTVYGSMTTGGASPYLTALGYNAAPSASGAHNTAVGYLSAYSITSGDRNVAVGNYALNGLQTGVYNTAIGFAALYTNTGSSNTAVGKDALYLNTSGATNVGIGVSALYSNTTASNNTAVGYQALYSSNRTADANAWNTAVGAGAGYAVTTGQFNVFIGKDTGSALTIGVANTFVGSGGITGGAGSAITTGSKNSILGAYTGNQDGLDIRTANNYAVISDGDGNRLLSTANGYSLALDGGAVPQSGTGITFPATQSASTDANTLDDYEEGTWTPTFTASTPGTMSNSYIVQTGRYTKVGRLVTASFAIRSTLTIGTASGDFLVGGLPFTSGNPGSDMEGGPVTFTQNTLPFSVNSLLVALGSTSIIPIMTNGNSFSPSTLGSGTYTFRGIVTYTV